VRREAARAGCDSSCCRSYNANKDGVFKVESDFQLSTQQFEVLKDAMEAIQKTAGVFHAMLGDKQPGGANSGIAINSLVEQGTTTLAEINDNYRFGKRMVGQALTELIVEDIGSQPQVVNVDEKFGTKKRQVTLNQPANKDGVQMLDNDVQRALVKVALEDVPSTPTYRAQQLLMLTEMTKAMPPQIQAFIVPFILESSEMPHRGRSPTRCGRPSASTPEVRIRPSPRTRCSRWCRRRSRSSTSSPRSASSSRCSRTDRRPNSTRRAGASRPTPR
jgi:hypothetical protein